MTDFIIETDLGHDPDDLFAICHLVEAGHRIVGLALTPGSPQQQAFAVGLRTLLGMDFLIGTQKPNAKDEHLGVHTSIAKSRGWTEGVADGFSWTVIENTMYKHPAADVLIIGPATGFGTVAHLAGRRKVTFQGGFLPYSLYRPDWRLTQFVNKESIPTFNFNGDRAAVENILKWPRLTRTFCGKNICHTVVLEQEFVSEFAQPRGVAGELYHEALRRYFDSGRHDCKKLHDPTALVCHLHPDVATYFRGKPEKREGGWTTVPGDDFILADIKRDLLWQHIFNRT